ncbi:MFS transporter [Alkalicaulis satelles]|uniref:MFS transporter n=1 Tax=Alkalicaulis satelles TaxID=2609175 RepID=A0A5M6ZCY9_9PROT|nr:MFS transporter [Alkalicaulis satelles]KAA5801697.1 MFS transporter [Alkalicaulis satelles]
MALRFLTDPALGRTRSLCAAILCAAMAGCGFGLLMPLVALNLEAMTGSGAVVGLNAAAAALSTIVATPLIPPLLARTPPRLTIVACAAFTGVGIIAFPFLPDVVVWFVLRFVIGLAVTVIFVASETWINQLAKPESRASLLAVYATVLSGGFGSGGILLAVLGAQGFAPWIAGGAIFLLGAVPLLLLRGPELEAPDRAEAGPLALWNAARLAPVAILAGFVFGALETSVFALVPVYAERLGFTETVVGLLVAVGALGAITMQIPIGRFADRVGRLTTLRLIAAAAVVLALLIALSGARLWALYPMIFLYVGVASAFYTVGLALIGERVRPGQLASANAAFIFAYGMGSLAGPVSAGAAMDAFNPWGMLVALALFAAAYLVIAGRSRER